jgi:methylphosphotriester-DNA--protein-cysteine methyltransferase
MTKNLCGTLFNGNSGNTTENTENARESAEKMTKSSLRKAFKENTEMLFEHGNSMGRFNEIKTKGIQQQQIPPMKNIIASGFNPRL